MLHVQHKTITHGVTSRMLRAGNGDPVLFLHGGEGLTGWLDYLDRLAFNYDVLAPEHPGFGKSERPAWTPSIADLARYYKTFCANLGQVNLIGSSLGGWLASRLAILAPEAISSLTLIAPAGMRGHTTDNGSGRLPTRAQRLQQLFSDQSFVERLLAQDPHDIMKIESANSKTCELLCGPEHYDPTLEKTLEGLECPTLILWGEDDNFISVEQAKLWDSAIAGAEVQVLSRCGHFPHVELPDEAARLTKAFLERATAMA
jgi:pimeloyl-ACP methyl ester carboxylesterase